MHKFWCLLLLSATAAAHAQPALAQPNPTEEERPPPRIVLGAGFGFAGGDGPTRAGRGLTGHAGLAQQRGPIVFALRFGMTAGGNTGKRVSGGGTLHDRFDEAAVLAGYEIHREPGSQVVLSTGIAVVSGERVAPDGRANRSFPTRIGVPIHLDLGKPGGGRSLGLGVHVNVNAEQLFGTVTIRYLIGRAER
jgi:hypothetical protein